MSRGQARPLQGLTRVLAKSDGIDEEGEVLDYILELLRSGSDFTMRMSGDEQEFRLLGIDGIGIVIARGEREIIAMPWFRAQSLYVIIKDDRRVKAPDAAKA
jgi:hypothetical protein